MTDKQIIIDGVDVSGCDRLNTFPMQFGEPHEICLTSLEQWGGQEKYCKDRPNCYYKQLKRKEQECEELKIYIESNEQQVKEVETLVMDNDRLINELDQLKAENNLLRQTHKTEQDRRRAYENALTEIKEIAKNGCYDDCGMPLDELSIILQKISEVEDG